MAVPVLTSLDPNAAVIGGPDLDLSALGSGFDANSVIVFNGGEEPTTFVAENELTTTVKPSTAGTAGAFAVLVRNLEGDSEALDFTFEEDAGEGGGEGEGEGEGEELTTVWNLTDIDLRISRGPVIPAHGYARVRRWEVHQLTDIVKGWLASEALSLTDPADLPPPPARKKPVMPTAPSLSPLDRRGKAPAGPVRGETEPAGDIVPAAGEAAS